MQRPVFIERPVVTPAHKIEEWTEPVTGMEFVRIPGGCFMMGSPPGEKDRKSDEGPVHVVCVEGFWMGKYEVTNEQFRKFQANHNSGNFKGHPLDGDSQPAVVVSWNDAVAFADFLNKKNGDHFSFRLPTEAEWEYACRGGTGTSRVWGDDSSQACNFANVYDYTSNKAFAFVWENHDCNDGFAVSSPVGSFESNTFGLHDMLGNVFEWCADIYGSNAYREHARNNPIHDRGEILMQVPQKTMGCASGPHGIYGGGGSARVYRGGSWFNESAYVRCANRGYNSPSFQIIYLGFRIAMTN